VINILEVSSLHSWSKNCSSSEHGHLCAGQPLVITQKCCLSSARGLAQGCIQSYIDTHAMVSCTTWHYGWCLSLV